MNDPMLVGAIGVFVVMVLLGITEKLILWHARRAGLVAMRGTRGTRGTTDAAAGLDQADAALDAAKEAISSARESLTAGR